MDGAHGEHMEPAAKLVEEVFEIVEDHVTVLLLRMEDVSARVHPQSQKNAMSTSVQVKQFYYTSVFL